ncbi:MAG: bifunctional DNA primase/polymerase, partial [Thermoplasmata archaeon]
MKRQSKAAFEKNWTDRGYKYDATELKAHLMNKGNYGVLTGFGDLTVIDADIKEVEELVKNNLPETLTVRSGGGGCHFYYRCPELEKPIRLKDEKPGDVGDVQHDGKMVVGPNSIHLSGNKYKIENKRKIAEVKPEDIKEALKKYVAKDDTDINDEILKETKKKIDDRNHKNINDQLSISQVVPLYNLKNLGDGIYQGSHPIHGSGSGWNFKVDTKRNIWVCFRHYDGTHAAAGGPVGYVAMEEGIAKCEDFKNNNPLKGKKFIEVLNILKEKHGFEIDESYKKKDSNDENGEDDKQKKDPDRFFNDGGFVPKFLADEIMSDVNFVVNKESEEIFYYDKGVYKSGGEGLVKELSDKKLEKKAKNHYVNETVERVRNHYKTRTDTRKFQGVENRIVVENGILDLEERVLKPHNPDEIHLEKLPVKYNP